MSRRRSSTLDRLLGRLDDLDAANLTALVQRLARERDLLETVFDTVREGVLVTDADAVIRYANRAGATLIGLKPGDIGKAVLWKWAPDLARTLPLGLAGTAGTASREIEVTYPEHRVLRVSISPMSPDGAPAGVMPEVAGDDRRFVVILADLTADRVSLEDRIADERTNSIFTLAASVAHEIGNPLNAMGIHVHLMRKALAKLPASPESRRLEDSVGVVASELNRLDGILKNFLEALRPRAPDLTDVNLLQVVGEVLAVEREPMTAVGIRVELNVGAGVPPISGDKGQLAQVFFNLLKNAREAMPKGGVIGIEATADDEFVCIRIRDTGVGMDREAVSRIFDPFYTTKSGGHGLGMMIVLRILRAHGAHADVDSEPGVGTTVTVRFPQKHRRVRLLGTAPREA